MTVSSMARFEAVAELAAATANPDGLAQLRRRPADDARYDEAMARSL